jgi:hypothetical protein
VSAHGTNPASAVTAGMRVVAVRCDDHGNVDVDDLRDKAAKHTSELAALMITYPSTHGVFEDRLARLFAPLEQLDAGGLRDANRGRVGRSGRRRRCGLLLWPAGERRSCFGLRVAAIAAEHQTKDADSEDKRITHAGEPSAATHG